jgi:MFS superfamily sulfate permease-like transporter
MSCPLPAQFVRAFRIAPLSFVVMLTTFLSTFLISIEDGLLIGVVSSVIMVIYQLSTVRQQSSDHLSAPCVF